MNTEARVQYCDDDIFILGNIAALAVREGKGESALPLLRLIQRQRPGNAASYIIEAMHLHSIGRGLRAIAFLEESGALEASRNRDEALAFHLCLLQETGQFQRAGRLGAAYLEQDILRSAAAVEAARTVVDECNAKLATSTRP